MLYGSRVSGRLVPIADLSALSKPGEVFEIHIETDGIPDEQIAIQQLLTLEQQFEDLRVLYIETDVANIKMQITDVGPGAIDIWSVLYGLPAILIVGAIVVIALIGYQLFTTQPTWVWFLALGAVLALWGIPKILRPAREALPSLKELRSEVKKTKEEEGTISAEEKLIERRKGAKTILADLREEIKGLRGDRRELKDEIKAEKARPVSDVDEIKRLGKDERAVEREIRKARKSQRQWQKVADEVDKQLSGVKED